MRGTWALRVHVSDGESPGKVYEGDELAVAGPSAVRSRVTAPPAAPQNPQGVTQRVQLPWPVPVGWYWVRRVR